MNLAKDSYHSSSSTSLSSHLEYLMNTFSPKLHLAQVEVKLMSLFYISLCSQLWRVTRGSSSECFRKNKKKKRQFLFCVINLDASV